MNSKNKKVFVGMSGGVDSSVAAALLQQQGYDVVGVFMENWSEDIGCNWDKEKKDALTAAQKLGIPFRVYNFETEYKKQVIDEFFNEYKRGRTPNPDIACNSRIKFGVFLDRARSEGADLVAMGHYARVKGQGLRGKYQLLKAIDETKDQTYFLSTLNQKQLSLSLFPIGNYKKTQVRQMARELGLPTAAKKDSQGICFVGNVDLREFLARHFPVQKGSVVDVDGKVIGEHDGVWFYTIGQRHGMNINSDLIGVKSSPIKSGSSASGQLPYYIVAKDAATNTLTVALGRHHPALYSSGMIVSDMHWIGRQPNLPLSCQVKIRYRQQPQECWLTADSSRQTAVGSEQLAVSFRNPQWAVTPGQYAVFYDGDVVLGSGVIERPVMVEKPKIKIEAGSHQML